MCSRVEFTFRLSGPTGEKSSMARYLAYIALLPENRIPSGVRSMTL